jgi:hypothetical protein
MLNVACMGKEEELRPQANATVWNIKKEATSSGERAISDCWFLITYELVTLMLPT